MSLPSTTACHRKSSVVRTAASAPAGNTASARSLAQSANHPAVAGRDGNAICDPIAAANSAVTTPVSAIAANTSRPRAAAAAGSTRGLNRLGARGRPASTAACHKFTLRADTPKYSRAAASTPHAPEPR